jgi:DNA replication and repair protein RecF
VLVRALRLLAFRNLASADVELADGVTLLWGPNGAGKTNVLEALCLVLSGRSPRTRTERETISFGEPLARVEATVDAAGEPREILWSLARDGDRRHTIDGANVTPATERPPLAIFLPDRLALVKGPPSVRRAHLDRLCAAAWPARAPARADYGRALAQRNALLGRIRSGSASSSGLDAWDRELARTGIELRATRANAVDRLAPVFAEVARELGLEGTAELRYRPRTEAPDAGALARELAERRESDVARGYTGHGPHLDELAITVGSRQIRRYGSQGEQRTALLALLFAERAVLLDARRIPPLMLLDDVMSELDAHHRALLARRLAPGPGQAVITATESDHLPPGCDRDEVVLGAGEVMPGPSTEVTRRPARVAP